LYDTTFEGQGQLVVYLHWLFTGQQLDSLLEMDQKVLDGLGVMAKQKFKRMQSQSNFLKLNAYHSRLSRLKEAKEKQKHRRQEQRPVVTSVVKASGIETTITK
jgi:hypothetical protein